MAHIRAKIHGMDCGSCALTIEDGVRQLPGVKRVAVNFTTESIDVEGEAALADIEHRVQQLGYRLEPLAAPDSPTVRADGTAATVATAPPAAAAPPAEVRGAAGFLRFIWQQTRLRIAALATLVWLVSLPYDVAWIPALIAVLVGAPVAVKGWRALLFGRRVTIDLLMVIATIGALLIGASGEAATVMLLYTLGEALEGYSAENARRSLRSLLALQPTRALLLRPAAPTQGDKSCHDGGHRCDHGQTPERWDTVAVPASDVHIGDRVLVRPGERVPVDGRILSGDSLLNEAAVTGESAPVQRGVGDTVLAGSLNGAGALEIEATRAASDSTIARIAQLVALAQAQRSPAERFVDRFARWYTPLVVMLAVAVALVPTLLFDQPLLDNGNGDRGWLYRGLALLIVACPCALVISIPVTVVSALTRLAQLGVLVKGGAQLDTLAELRILAFDKTGTLTRGKPTVTAMQSERCAHPAVEQSECQNCDDVLALAVAVEQRSEHPLAQAVLAAAGERGVQHRYGSAANVRAIPGRGVVGQVGGSQVAVGNPALFGADSEHALAVPELLADGVGAASRTVMLVAKDRQVIGAIGVEDELRSEAAEALAQLHALTPPVRSVMLTGDHPDVAAAIARRVGGIDEVKAQLLPEAKLQAIEALQSRHGLVGMVGDGINDAPALARADIGIAMGGVGSPQAMETADVVLMQDDLRRVPRAIALARRARRLVKENIALSLGLKLAFVALMIPGWATLWLAVAADVGATLIVTMNGMRLLRA
ncbi:MAG: cation-translocating P-type ATPase [Steroidobacteraceae bacterium]|nr:cation-translocating P-type ATPase [Steroidobacteraceae bacterium]MDW8258545.1 cation-translocating P-type ATPase [Gammaproteobacteria bacterium]